MTLTDRASVRAAALEPSLDPTLRAILKLRYEQMGGAGAHFHVADETDDPVVAEQAVGWPLTVEGQASWEWLHHHHGGWIEVVFILSDDGPAQVLLVPDKSVLSALVLSLEPTAAG